MRKLKGDNRGLSLIEVLVAVMIIAFVAVPIMHSFVTSAHANSRAKRTHKATVLAQSVMEGIKSEKLEDICKQFNYPNVDFRVLDTGIIGDGSNLADCVSEMGDTYIELKNYEDLIGPDQIKDNVTSSVYSTDNGVTTEFLGQDSGTYYFGLEDVKEDTSVYDVLIKVDAAAYRGSGVNAEKMSQVQPIDLNKDVMFIQKDEYTEDAFNEFKALYGANDQYIRDNMTRKITIEVVPPAGGVTTVKVKYEYNCYVPGIGSLPSYSKEDYRDLTQELRSVYLYYYPLYNDLISDPANSRDTIEFDNAGAVSLDFYLMKQNGTTTTQYQEDLYLPNLVINETGATVGNMKTRLLTNLVMNIADPNNSFFTNFSNFKVKLDGSNTTLDQITSITSVLATDAVDRFFDVTVGIYEDGAKDSGYPEADKLAEITGSRLQ